MHQHDGSFLVYLSTTSFVVLAVAGHFSLPARHHRPSFTLCLQLFELRLRQSSNHEVVAEAVHCSLSDLNRNHAYALHTPKSARDIAITGNLRQRKSGAVRSKIKLVARLNPRVKSSTCNKHPLVLRQLLHDFAPIRSTTASLIRSFFGLLDIV